MIFIQGGRDIDAMIFIQGGRDVSDSATWYQVVSKLNSTVTSLRFEEAPIIDVDSDTLNNAICAENPTGEIYSIKPENEQTYAAITGRRIIAITYFFNKLKEISNHNPLFTCGIQYLTLLGEKRLSSLLISSNFKFCFVHPKLQK